MSNQSGFFWEESFLCSTGASLASNQYYIVMSTGLSTLNQNLVSLCVSATAGVGRAIGVLQNSPSNSPQQTAAVRIEGITKVVATTTGSVAYGDPLTCSTAGTAMTAGTTGQYVFAQSLMASTGGANTLIEARLVSYIWMGATG